jgi:hypothetical protein
MNETFRELNVSALTALIISLDDDKKKASVGKNKDSQGLKKHVLPDRRKGIVGHTAVSPATMLTLGVCWEMEEKSSYDCYVKLVEDIFGSKPTLDRVTFCSDRGYWILELLRYILKNGGDIHGTVRRQHWFGLTFEQDLRPGDSRVDIPTAGPATLYAAEATISDRTVSANGYRNGTGGVALTMSTVYHGHGWECVVDEAQCRANKIPLVVSHEQRRGLLFRPAGSNSDLDSSVVLALGALPIEHVTEYQGSHEWHKARLNSATSSGVDRQVAIQIRIDKEREERKSHWVGMERYLSMHDGIEGDDYSDESGMGLTMGSMDESDAAGTESGTGTPNGSGGSNEGSNTDSSVPDNVSHVGTSAGSGTAAATNAANVEMMHTVEGMIKDATDTTDRNVDYCRKLIEEIKDGKHSSDVIGELVRQMGGNVYTSVASNQKQAIKWLESKPERRPFVLLNKAQLKVSQSVVHS